MAIKDIKFMNREGYLLKELPMTSQNCEKQMACFSYDEFYKSFRGFCDETGVEKTDFPFVVHPFYCTIFEKNRLPSPQELLEKYYKMNDNVILVNGDSIVYHNKVYKKRALDARILRTYPSLLRDYHFYLLLVEAGCFERVIYSCKNDIKGKDITVQHKGREYTVSLFVKTPRSTLFKQIKNAVRHIYSCTEIQLPLDLDHANTCGDFFIYGEKDLEHVKSIILKKKSKSNPFNRNQKLR